MLNTPIDPAKMQLLDAILPHVAFDGWAPSAFNAAVAEVDIDPAHAKTLCPRGAVDLAVAYHQRGDAEMRAALATADMSDMRFRDKVAYAIRLRLAAIDDKEAVRRGTALFALPHMAPDGAKLIWGTADAIWDALGDTSQDGNWYSKRLILSGVYSATVLFWLGDDSFDQQATDAFIDRRIDDVMQFEKVKASVNKNPLLKPLTGPLGRLMGSIKAPSQTPRADLPGTWSEPQ
ncbi:COQ9 family protein [Yoonia sediminilitoris]|uniref:Ubiquinone biosynthesis protein COQ9 n=1 Tax=Yoonia sediminilitoris TaxID=1286148 RepID=A0A2T6KH29_9RHOB|nr:COQ9 family protein [Yoonia sediminilitoris]PUB14826.1 ubiquinone biosynthesis protein COQ9 [Yoonia sediminilitoris]RCW95543.1 ubiquinone biosynthesis protein COQ9 [Yoonia sediminilitoris]